MFRLFPKRERVRTVAVVDVGSGDVGAGIFTLLPGGEARLGEHERKVLPLEERSRAHLIVGLKTLLREVGERVLARHVDRGGDPPGEAYAVIHAPWSRSRAHRARRTFPEETRVTDAMLSELAREAAAKETEYQRHLLEKSLLQVELNGYPTRAPSGKEAREIEVVALVSDCEPRVRTLVEEIVPAIFPVRRPALRSGARAFLATSRARSGGGGRKDALLVDLNGESTNFIVVREGAASEFAEVGEGVRSILRRIAPGFAAEETISALRMIARDQCASARCEEVLESLARVESDLARVFGEAFGKMSAPRRLPNEFFLATHPDLASWLLHFFSRIDFAQFTKTTQPFFPTLLEGEGAGGSADQGLSLAAALINIESFS